MFLLFFKLTAHNVQGIQRLCGLIEPRSRRTTAERMQFVETVN